MFRLVKLKLLWRVFLLVVLVALSALYCSVRVLSDYVDISKANLQGDTVLYKEQPHHLGVARKLVNKSFWGVGNIFGLDLASLKGQTYKVNHVDEAVRRKYIFKRPPSLEVDLSADYINKVFTADRRDTELFSPAIQSMTIDQLIEHINRYRHEIRRKGKKMKIFDDSAIKERARRLKEWESWYLNISQYELYQHDDATIDHILRNMATLPIVDSGQFSAGTQLKLEITFADELHALWKPMRFTREVETLPNHFYFSDYERHTAEIAAFHLDRVMGFRRAPPVAGRILNITTDIEAYADLRLKKTIFTSPSGNRCFYGRCSYYCDSGHAICGHPDWLEGSAAAFLPDDDFAAREDRRNPWRRSYSRRKKANWEIDPNYCDNVKTTPPFNKGRVLLDLIDLHIFDFIQANMDRHHYELFDFPSDWGNDTTPIALDNGRAWGKMFKDEITILAPLQQCCQVRYSTVQKLLLYDEGPFHLSDLLDRSTSRDPLYPILIRGHLLAADRRVKIVLKEIQQCVGKLGWDDVIKDDGF